MASKTTNPTTNNQLEPLPPPQHRHPHPHHYQLQQHQHHQVHDHQISFGMMQSSSSSSSIPGNYLWVFCFFFVLHYSVFFFFFFVSTCVFMSAEARIPALMTWVNWIKRFSSTLMDKQTHPLFKTKDVSFLVNSFSHAHTHGNFFLCFFS